MGWGEAIRLFQILQNDPSAQIGAALQGWDFPFDRVTAAVLDLFDLEHAKAAKRPKPHPGRPFALKGSTTRRKGNAGGRTRAQVLDVLRRFGHRFGEPDPSP